MIKASIHREKLRVRVIPPAITGAIQRGTITGICLLYFCVKRVSLFFGLSLEAILPYPQGPLRVLNLQKSRHNCLIYYIQV